MSASPTFPENRLRTWHAWLVVWRVHRWLGLGAGALLVLLSLTGSLLVVHHEIEAFLERDRRAVHAVPGAPLRPLKEILSAAAAAAPGDHRLFRVFPGEADETCRVLFLAPDNTTRWTVFVDPFDATVRWSGPDQRLLTPWLLGLHMQLHAGRAGYYVTGAAGLGLTLLALTGLYLHRDHLRTLARHPFRLRLGWRVALSDLHKWTGIAALYFPLVLGVTGTLYVWRSLGVKPAPSTVARLELAALAPLEPMLAAAQQQFPAGELLRLQFPAEAKGALTVLVLHRDNPPWQKFSQVTFDPLTGARRGLRDATQASAAEQFASLLAPLHFGFYGATWVKAAYFVGGFAPGVLAITGVLLWLVRTRRRAPGTVADSFPDSA
jgi:uncharacterized iron-regulated membrane protein